MNFLSHLTNNCLENNETDVTQIDNMLLSNPSILTEIFIPVFLDSTVFLPTSESDTFELSKNKLKKDFAQQYSTWGNKIRQFINSNYSDSPFEVFLIKIYIAFWNVLLTSECAVSCGIQWKLNCIIYWLQRISSLNGDHFAISSIGLNYIQSIRQNITSYTNFHENIIELQVLELINTINNHIDSYTSPINIVKYSSNKKPKLNYWKVVEADEVTVWPLGMVPGVTQYPYLHHIKEYKGV
jgi:hypothetical protein